MGLFIIKILSVESSNRLALHCTGGIDPALLTEIMFQVFGLIRDPGAENNWKIKQTEARLVGGQVEVVPNVNTSKLEAVTFS